MGSPLFEAGDWKDFAKRARTETDPEKLRILVQETDDLRTVARAEACQEQDPVPPRSPL